MSYGMRWRGGRGSRHHRMSSSMSLISADPRRAASSTARRASCARRGKAVHDPGGPVLPPSAAGREDRGGREEVGHVRTRAGIRCERTGLRHVLGHETRGGHPPAQHLPQILRALGVDVRVDESRDDPFAGERDGADARREPSEGLRPSRPRSKRSVLRRRRAGRCGAGALRSRRSAWRRGRRSIPASSSAPFRSELSENRRVWIDRRTASSRNGGFLFAVPREISTG